MEKVGVSHVFPFSRIHSINTLLCHNILPLNAKLFFIFSFNNFDVFTFFMFKKKLIGWCPHAFKPCSWLEVDRKILSIFWGSLILRSDNKKMSRLCLNPILPTQKLAHRGNMGTGTCMMFSNKLHGAVMYISYNALKHESSCRLKTAAWQRTKSLYKYSYRFRLRKTTNWKLRAVNTSSCMSWIIAHR